jgi:ketosteroid isomerase-like protein
VSTSQAVRKSLSVGGRSRRALLERLALRVPRYFHFWSRMLFRLPPTSGIRQAFVWRGNQLAYEAFNRRDFEAFAITFHPQAGFRNPRELVELGIGEARCHGPEEYVRLLNAWSSAWGELRVSPRELTDFGDRQLMLGEIRGRGAGSGITVSQPLAVLNTYKHGRMVLHQGWFDHAQALRAAGLREHATSRENVEIVRNAYDELARGNLGPFRDRLDPEIVYWLREDDPEPGPYRGADAAMEFIAEPTEFVDVHTEAHEIIDAGECVVAWVRTTARGAASGAIFDVEGAILHRFEGGRIVEMREYAERAEALESAGFSQ